jgi:hypothetical protein
MSTTYNYNISDFVNATNVNIGNVFTYLNDNINMVIKVAHIL